MTRMRRRGTVLLVVLIVIAIGAMVGSTALYYTDAQIRATSHSLGAAQGRALAWSGVQAVMAELAAQRESLLRGGTPSVAAEGAVFGDETRREPRGVYRVIASGERTVASDTGRLDLNTATAEMIAKLPGLDAAAAGRIVAARAAGPFTSVHDLLVIEGITPAMVFGAGAGGDGGDRSGDGSDSPRLADLVTVFSADPMVQTGIAAPGARAPEGVAGEARINIAAGWTEDLDRAVEQRLDRPTADAVKTLLQKPKPIASDADLIRGLRSVSVPAAQWPVLLDLCATTADPYRIGRMDLLTAPVEVLACLPGIDAAAAERIVEGREKLDAGLRGTVVWPVLEGILTEEQFQAVADWVTVRSMQYRVVVEGGIVDLGDEAVPTTSGKPRAQSGGTPDRPGLRDRIVLEAVIDVSAPHPRIAYLRDITLLSVADALAIRAAAAAREPNGEPEEPTEPAPTPRPEAEQRASAPVTPRREGDYRVPQPVPADQETNSSKKFAVDNRIGRWTTGQGGTR